jgi:DnaK suppressor protein
MTEKTHYTAAELAEFNELLNVKMAEAENDLKLLNTTLEHATNDAKGDDFAGEQMTREETQLLKQRQEKFIQRLQAAQARIRNGTYGICQVSGRLIGKERLRLVPHATMSIEAKHQQNGQ